MVWNIDAEAPLGKMRDVFQEDVPMVDILDLPHVTPRLWDAAAVFYSRQSREAEGFVRQRLLRIRQAGVGLVVPGLRRMGSCRGLRGAKLTQLERICGYSEKNLRRMRDDDYAEDGYLIASGKIQAACWHIVKDRVGLAGMRWTIAGAPALLDLRRVYLSRQGEAFVAFRSDCERERLCPYQDRLESQPCSVAA